MSGPLLTLYAYLGARDSTFAGNGAMSFAIATREGLKEFKRGPRGEAVDVLAAFDDGDSDTTRCFRIGIDGGEEDVLEHSGLSYAEGFEEFLTWAQPLDGGTVPRILLWSGHGTPGFGITDGVMRAYLERRLDVATDEADELLSRLIQNDSPTDSAIPENAIAKLRETFGSSEVQDLLRLENEQFLQTVSWLISLRRHPPQREVGLTLLAAGDRENDRLSVRRLGQIIEDRSISFDVTILQSCALGLSEIAYELHPRSRALILCSCTLWGRIYIGPILTRIVEHACLENPADFAAIAGLDFLQTEEASRISFGDHETAFFASRDDETIWARFVDAFAALAEELIARFSTQPEDTRRQLIEIRDSSRPCPAGSEPNCAQQVHDLCDFAQQVKDRFDGGFTSLADELIAAHNAVLIRRFASPHTGECCPSNGMTLYFPTRSDLLYSSYDGAEANPEGFSLLDSVRWRRVLELMLDP